MSKQPTFRNGLFFLIGVLIYSFFFWITDRNYVHVFGILLIALCCAILYKIEYKTSSTKERIKTKDIIYICIGIIFDSFSSGFPFSYLK
jgi:uncharacterized membrane protein